MADLKISQLTALTAIAADAADVLPVVDTSATTTKKISLSDVAEYVAGSDAITGALAGVEPDYTSDQAVLAASIF